MFSLLPVYHKAKSLDKGFSAWYKMLSNAAVQYLVSRADLKEMASTIKQNNTLPPKKSGKQVQQRVQVWCTVIITALLSHRADFYLYWISLISILYVYTCLCVRVHFLSKRDLWRQGGRERVKNWMQAAKMEMIFVFYHTRDAPFQLLSFKAVRDHALMPAGWPCIVIIQSSCSHHVSSDQRRVYKVKASCKIYAYMAVSVSGKINTAGLMHRNDWVLSDWH